ncbi:hypothetical protein AWC38_SpisGene13304 [Stylophora pistillata]|uniref:Amyloid protein-binding protein 2 n=1 Tax=Stylophora pistillata TaxID=50429 RepID=A0A2B4S0T8_STYPI|nr:hypothetical protein AWC38_SpisGene13304 [Stylophora pistillata]
MALAGNVTSNREHESLHLTHFHLFGKIVVDIVRNMPTSVAECYQNQLESSLQMIDEALNMIDSAKNQELLRGRGYGYIAGVKRRQRNLGEAMRYVDLAEQINHTCHTHLDTSFIDYERAGVLLEFNRPTACRSQQQENEAVRNLETCIDVCTKLETESNLYVKKHHFALIKMAMLLLDCRTEAARERVVSDNAIAKGQQCLNRLKTEYWSLIAEGVKVQFNLVSSDLQYRKGNYSEAERYANCAKDLATEMGFNTEIHHAQERLNHIRALTWQDAMLDGPVGGASLCSDSEGGYGDVSSSSGYESDCLNSKDLKILE